MLPIRMFMDSKSGASDLIRPSTACLDAEYRAPLGILTHDARHCLDFYGKLEVWVTYPWIPGGRVP